MVTWLLLAYRSSSFQGSDDNLVSSCKPSAVPRTPLYQLHTRQNIATQKNRLKFYAQNTYKIGKGGVKFELDKGQKISIFV